ncbi:MAG: hypothetical protein ACRD0Q_03045 [Acidimicrobiales bacterium]
MSEVRQPRTGTRTFWVSAAAGWALMAFGVRGLLDQHLATNPTGFGRLLVGTALVHDLLVAPLVFGAGLLVGRLVPAPVRSVVQGGLICSGLVTLYAFPFVRGYGRAPTNPSALPGNYGRGLAVILLAIWVVTAALAALRTRSTRS